MKNNSETTALILGFIVISFLSGLIKVAIVMYFVNEIFDKQVVEMNMANIFYGWCIYLALKFDVKFEFSR